MNTQSDPLQGQCLCGAFKVELSGGLGRTMECHCADCQKAVGGGPAYIAMVPRSDAKLSGALKGYTVKAESGGNVTRCFCPECGTPTHTELDKYPDHYIFKVGLFTPQSAAAPSVAIWMRSAPEWHPVVDGIPQFDTTPNPAG